ncbi:hypothetical protein [Agromyces rhizosphaerae]|nr:hypothetical protein [Agromyces rhizosphaerae]
MTDERAGLPDSEARAPQGATRRRVLRGAAWSVPAIAVAATVPQAAASEPVGEAPCAATIRFVQACAGVAVYTLRYTVSTTCTEVLVYSITVTDQKGTVIDGPALYRTPVAGGEVSVWDTYPLSDHPGATAFTVSVVPTIGEPVSASVPVGVCP